MGRKFTETRPSSSPSFSSIALLLYCFCFSSPSLPLDREHAWSIQSFGDAEVRLKQKIKVVGTKGSSFLKIDR